MSNTPYPSGPPVKARCRITCAWSGLPVRPDEKVRRIIDGFEDGTEINPRYVHERFTTYACSGYWRLIDDEISLDAITSDGVSLYLLDAKGSERNMAEYDGD